MSIYKGLIQWLRNNSLSQTCGSFLGIQFCF